MRSDGNNFNYFPENQLTKFSAATAGLLVNFGHTLSVGLLVAVPATTALKLVIV